jgi:hypothetical protein
MRAEVKAAIEVEKPPEGGDERQFKRGEEEAAIKGVGPQEW